MVQGTTHGAITEDRKRKAPAAAWRTMQPPTEWTRVRAVGKKRQVGAALGWRLKKEICLTPCYHPHLYGSHPSRLTDNLGG